MDTHHPGDSGFWRLGGVGRRSRSREGGPVGLWILDSGYWAVRRRSRVGGPSDSGFWILDTARPALLEALLCSTYGRFFGGLPSMAHVQTELMTQRCVGNRLSATIEAVER